MDEVENNNQIENILNKKEEKNDNSKINSNRTLWELVNLILPVIIVVFAGLLLIWARKRKYSS